MGRFRVPLLSQSKQNSPTMGRSNFTGRTQDGHDAFETDAGTKLTVEILDETLSGFWVGSGISEQFGWMIPMIPATEIKWGLPSH
ncbi:hypothetical protein RP20_CCG015825 [Aedes albopictus]|nr:hypothetical protein RP20_CCG015825 [Aedes albopictus]